MAQRLLHYLIGERLIEGALAQYSPEEAARFRFGNLLPDAYPPGRAVELRRVTHFIVHTGEDGRGRYSDFEYFRRVYAERIPTDPLYLGYYLHLVSDACYRRLFYQSAVGDFERSAENISFLHRDYHILNALIVQKNGIGAGHLTAVPIKNEPIADIAPFDGEGLIADLLCDLAEKTTGELRFLPPDFPERFIQYALPVCRDALLRLLNGMPMESAELAWEIGE